METLLNLKGQPIGRESNGEIRFTFKVSGFQFLINSNFCVSLVSVGGVFTMKGSVKFFNRMKNYGFIAPDEGDEDLFVHMNDIESGILNEEDRVEFDSEQGDKGPKAVNVKKIE